MSATAPGLRPDERVLVHLVALRETVRPGERPLYRSIEWGAELTVRALLRGCYRSRVALYGRDATLDALVEALATATAEPGVKAVDLVVNPHGTTRRLVFVDGAVDADQVCRRLLQRLDRTQQRRLRAVFSSACYGMWHTDAWLRSGFAVAVGSRGIYADGLSSLPRMLRQWSAGATVEQAVAAANATVPRHRHDAAAARYYRLTGRGQQAAAVDSERVVDGARAMTIMTDPARYLGPPGGPSPAPPSP